MLVGGSAFHRAGRVLLCPWVVLAQFELAPRAEVDGCSWRPCTSWSVAAPSLNRDGWTGLLGYLDKLDINFAKDFHMYQVSFRSKFETAVFHEAICTETVRQFLSSFKLS